MDRTAESVIHEGLQLPPEERQQVVERLAESLQDDVANAWLKEVRERKARWDAGLVEGVDGRDIIRDLRARAAR